VSIEPSELSVSEARDRFSEAVNHANYAGHITYVTRGRGHHRTAAIVPAELVEDYEAMLDREEGRIAQERLDDLRSGRTASVSADEAKRTLGL
jgi:PHD/YefM family antitoxin component YafN of YafNO toxin-antitoxin module